MATMLPAIDSTIGKQPSYGMQRHGVGDKPTAISFVRGEKKKLRPLGPPKVVARQLMNKKEQQLDERRLNSRAKLPDLSETQTAEYLNSYKHTLCVEMLQKGFHHSFSEIFNLIKQQEDRRQSAGPDSSLWNQKSLEDEHDKLDMMRDHLVAAESAMLLGDYLRVYQCHHYLAQYFLSTGDKWLSDHFFQNCLRYSANVKGDNGRVAAEGHCNVGISLELAGSLDAAASNFELCYGLTKGKSDWVVEDGKTAVHSQSCNHLKRIYTSIANQHRANKDREASLQYLVKAYDMAKEGGDRKLFGEASYELGLAYIENGDPETALMHLQSYLETCQALKDSEGLGKACEAIARAHDSQGHVEESIKYLQRFIQVSEDSKDDKALSHACNSLGIRFNCLGEYKQAFDNFSRAYNISRTINDSSLLHLSRVLSGTAHAHEILLNYSRHVETPQSRTSVARLLEWKDNRGDEFERPLTPPKAETPAAVNESRPQTRQSEMSENEETSETKIATEDNMAAAVENALKDED